MVSYVAGCAIGNRQDQRPMTDEELADEIRRLADELHRRGLTRRPQESLLAHQLWTAALEVASWPTYKQRAMRSSPDIVTEGDL